MPKYLVSVSYTAEGAKGVRKDGGTKRRHVASKAVEGVGGKVEAFYFALGEHDVFLIADMPDNIAVAALSLAVSATGGARVRTTALMTAEEMDHASQKKTPYKAPGA